MKDVSCLESELMAAYIDGGLSESEKAGVERHLGVCGACYDVFAESLRFRLGSEGGHGGQPADLREPGPAVAAPSHFPKRALLGAASLLAAGLIVFAAVRLGGPPGLAGSAGRRELVRAVGAHRPVEPRLTGGFIYGPLRPVTRGPVASEETESFEVQAAAARLRKDADERPGPETLGDAAAAFLIVGRTDEAVSKLETASLQDPKDARLLSDLSAAYFVRGRRLEQPLDISRAADAAGQAIALDPKLTEALFNRALALEVLPPKSAASKAWKEYLEVDSSSPWANEARRHLMAMVVPGSAQK